MKLCKGMCVCVFISYEKRFFLFCDQHEWAIVILRSGDIPVVTKKTQKINLMHIVWLLYSRVYPNTTNTTDHFTQSHRCYSVYVTDPPPYKAQSSVEHQNDRNKMNMLSLPRASKHNTHTHEYGRCAPVSLVRTHTHIAHQRKENLMQS